MLNLEQVVQRFINYVGLSISTPSNLEASITLTPFGTSPLRPEGWNITIHLLSSISHLSSFILISGFVFGHPFIVFHFHKNVSCNVLIYGCFIRVQDTRKTWGLLMNPNLQISVIRLLVHHLARRLFSAVWIFDPNRLGRIFNAAFCVPGSNAQNFRSAFFRMQIRQGNELDG